MPVQTGTHAMKSDDACDVPAESEYEHVLLRRAHGVVACVIMSRNELMQSVLQHRRLHLSTKTTQLSHAHTHMMSRLLVLLFLFCDITLVVGRHDKIRSVYSGI